MEQLELFKESKSEVQHLWEVIIDLKESHRKTQKRLFSELNDVKRRMTEAQAQIARYEALNQSQQWEEPKLMEL